MDSHAVQGLGLGQKGFALANVPAAGGLTLGFQQEIGLSVLHPSGDFRRNLFIPELLALELDLNALGYQVLIGRDVLSRCRFLFDGPGDRFRLQY